MNGQIDPDVTREMYFKFRDDFELFCFHCLKVRTKAGNLVPFVMNRAQRALHAKLEAQLAKTGKVRALVLKGRQQGISTYVAARFYWKSCLNPGINVYILAHEQPASDALFSIVDRFHQFNPFRPRTGRSNAKELEFMVIGSKYKVATAGQKAGGRSTTGTLFHGSEVAFWQNAIDHFAASVQTIPDEPGTEIILETTASGPSGEFYERWQEGEIGDSDYMPIFIPWFWQEEYTRPCEVGFELWGSSDPEEASEEDYSQEFHLSNEQMRWRRGKIQEMRSHGRFDQEYPATAQTAFSNTDDNVFIKARPVLQARKRTVEGAGPLIMGADPAGPGGDRFAICGRRGYSVEYLDWRNKLETSEAYHWCKSLIIEHNPARFYVDGGGIGASIFSLLLHDEELRDNYPGVIRKVNFGARSQFKDINPTKAGPKNRRAEMWNRMREWLLDTEVPPSIPDLDVLQADITSPRLKPNITNDIQLESKEDMRSRRVRSPDLADALALTFASSTIITDWEEKKPGTDKFGNPDAVRKNGKRRDAGMFSDEHMSLINRGQFINGSSSDGCGWI